MIKTSFLLWLLPLTMSAQNAVSVVKDAPAVTYNPMIFGQFIEHFDNQIYGGIFDPGNPLSDEHSCPFAHIHTV